MTVHLSKQVKENMDAVKGNRPFEEVIAEVLNETFNLEKEIKRLPVSKVVISNNRGSRKRG